MDTPTCGGFGVCTWKISVCRPLKTQGDEEVTVRGELGQSLGVNSKTVKMFTPESTGWEHVEIAGCSSGTSLI